MTTATRRTLQTAAGLLLAWGTTAGALTLDDQSEMRLGMRAYSNIRVNTEAQRGGDDPLSFPRSGVGHIRQHRYFLQLKFDHNLKRLSQNYGWGWLLGGWMNPDEFSYSLQYRGEGEGIYDYGATEWSSRTALDNFRSDLPSNPALGLDPEVCARKLKRPDGSVVSFCDERLSKLRRIARQRHRFFAGYLDIGKGPVSVRVGRQVLVWGETDVFQLLDRINPTDAGFGGFLLALDERRVPLDMVRASYRFGQIGPSSDTFLEGFVAQGNKVGQVPGIPGGSAWSPGGIGNPNPQLRQIVEVPDRWDMRGGARLVGNLGDVTASVAHYWTYFDTPTVRFTLPGASTCSDADPNTPGLNSPTPKYCNPIIARALSPRVPITGASLSFPVPSLASIVRSEVAYNHGEPFNRQGRGSAKDANALPGTAGFRRLWAAKNFVGGLDPFVYPRFLDITRTQRFTGSALRLDTFNASLGIDINRLIPWLNSRGTSFISAQMFYRHAFDSPGDLILPTPYYNKYVHPKTFGIGRDSIAPCKTKAGKNRSCAAEPRFFRLADNQFTNTLLFAPLGLLGQAVTIPGLNTAVSIAPAMQMLYDWQGAYVLQPALSINRFPFTFSVDYSFIGGTPAGQIGNLRDRDNVRAQIEFAF
jgi:Protein of unknown function (DUF1302)